MRLVDRLYLGYFYLWLPLIFLFDLQPFYPQEIIPTSLQKAYAYNLQSDPFLGRRLGDGAQMAW